MSVLFTFRNGASYQPGVSTLQVGIADAYRTLPDGRDTAATMITLLAAERLPAYDLNEARLGHFRYRCGQLRTFGCWAQVEDDVYGRSLSGRAYNTETDPLLALSEHAARRALARNYNHAIVVSGCGEFWCATMPINDWPAVTLAYLHHETTGGRALVDWYTRQDAGLLDWDSLPNCCDGAARLGSPSPRPGLDPPPNALGSGPVTKSTTSSTDRGADSNSWQPTALLTAKELCTYLGISQRTLTGWITQKTAPRRMRIGHHIRFMWSDVQAWLADREKGLSPDPIDPNHTSQQTVISLEEALALQPPSGKTQRDQVPIKQMNKQSSDQLSDRAVYGLAVARLAASDHPMANAAVRALIPLVIDP